MITGLDHIAVLCSSEESIEFYKKLGFEQTMRKDRENDIVLMMTGHGFTLELFIDPSHPPRVNAPEAMGLRHLAFHVDNIEETIAEYGLKCDPIKIIDGKKLAFFYDPDGLPLEFHE